MLTTIETNYPFFPNSLFVDLASASAAAAIGVATTVRDEEDSQDNRLNSRAQDENSLFTHQQPSKVCFHVVPL